MHYYIDVLKKYAEFSGRTTRKEFWMFVLISNIIAIVLTMIDGSTILPGLYTLAVLIPNLAVGARRLHDTNRSGWWQLLSLIPFVGIIILIVWFAGRTVNEENKYGEKVESENIPADSEQVVEEVVTTTVEEEVEVKEEVAKESPKEEVENK